MSSIDNKSTHSWGLSAGALDDWLENDLKQSNLLTDTHPSTNCTFNSNIKKDCKFTQHNNHSIQPSLQAHAERNNNSVHTDNRPSLQMENGTLILLRNGTKIPIPPHLIPIIKAYSKFRNNVHIKPETVATNEELVTSVNDKDTNNTKRLITPPPTSPETVNKSLKGKKSDLITKRQRNTDAARRSRLRKAVKMESLESKVGDLKTNNDRLRVRVAVLESERDQISEKEKRNRQYVLELEAQLAQAHSRLVGNFHNDA
jgi:hypothetical protein